jgi:nucleoside-diphosphate-sugar epimerase
VPRILITGASGCIGHYVVEALAADPDAELILFVRNPRKLRLSPGWPASVTVVPGDMREIGRFAALLRSVEVGVLAATAWGGPEAWEINHDRTLELLSLLNPQRCRQVLYFSTASVLDRHNRPLPEAGRYGTWYIRSKYETLLRLPALAVAPQTTVLAPTLVFGGDAERPQSFLSLDLPGFVRLAGLVRFLSVEGSFHFIHARDVAQVVRRLVRHPEGGGGLRTLVLGQPAMTFDGAVEEMCAALGRRIYFRIPLPIWRLSPLVPLLQRHVLPEDRAWGAFCLRYRHFTHEDPVNPATFGLPSYCPTLTTACASSGVFRRRIADVPDLPSSP